MRIRWGSADAADDSVSGLQGWAAAQLARGRTVCGKFLSPIVHRFKDFRLSGGPKDEAFDDFACVYRPRRHMGA